MPAGAYTLALKVAVSALAIALGWLGWGIIPITWAVAFLCATLPAIWSRQSSVRRRVRAALCGIGVALFVYLCMVGIVVGLMTWSHEPDQIAGQTR
jgi:hypothetical protein